MQLFAAGKGGLRAAFFLSLVVAFQTGEVLAHGDEKPKHGGIMGRGDDTVTVEFVFGQSVVTVYVEDHDSAAPIPAHELGGAWLSLSGPGGRLPREVKLVPSGGNTLTASGLSPRVGDRLSLRLILPNGMETLSTVTFREARR